MFLVQKKLIAKFLDLFTIPIKVSKMILPKFYKSNSQKLKDLYVDSGQFYFGKKLLG